VVTCNKTFTVKIFSAEQLYKADQITTEKQDISSIELMERASGQIFQWLHARLQGAQLPIHIFCGIGNNGGDGLALARMLVNEGYNANVYVANFTDKRSKCFLINYDRYKSVTKKWPILMRSEADFPPINKDEIIVDCLFGIGLNRAPEGWVKKLIQYLNEQPVYKLSVDIPSGLPANSPIPDTEAVVKSDHILSFQTPKLSFFLPQSAPFVKFWQALDIGLDPMFLQGEPPLAQLVFKPQAQTFYRQREKFAHKGTFGHTLIAGGSYGKMGAIVLSSRAALRIGSGWVSALIPEHGNTILQTAVPEVMTIPLKDVEALSNYQPDFEPTSIAVGMGMGLQDKSETFLAELFKNQKSNLVIDADAINTIAKAPKLLDSIPKNSILTPHEGELKRLVGAWTDDFDKIAKAQEFSKKHEVIIVIKGAHTITVFGDQLYINTTGNPGMATAGSGDVLSGMIAGLLAQSYEALLATLFAVYLHGSAGNIATGNLGFEAITASDISKHIGPAFLELFRQEESNTSE